MYVHNRLLCPNPEDDPAPGTKKKLQVVYLYADEGTVSEDTELTLPLWDKEKPAITSDAKGQH